MYDPPEPCAWRGEDRSRENSEGWRSGFLSEIGSVPASDAEADWDTGPLRSEPGLVDSRLVGYNCGQTISGHTVNSSDTDKGIFQMIEKKIGISKSGII